MGRRHDTLESLEKRRRAWAKEVGTNSEYAEAAPRIVEQLDAEIAAYFGDEPVIELTDREKEIIDKRRPNP